MSLSPSAEHFLGTDKSGRDVFTRLLCTVEEFFVIFGFIVYLLVICFWYDWGAIAGYFGGIVDSIY